MKLLAADFPKPIRLFSPLVLNASPLHTRPSLSPPSIFARDRRFPRIIWLLCQACLKGGKEERV